MTLFRVTVRIFSIALFATLSLGCRQYFSLWGSGGNENLYPPLSQQEKLQKLNFAYLSKAVFIPKCVSCHGSSGNVNVESYASVKSSQKAIYNSVFVTGSMPKGRSLSQEQLALLYNWLKAGAPEGIPLEEEPLQATFASLDSRIFQVKCIDCHAPGKKAEKVPLTREGLLNPDEDYVFPGRPDESMLVQVIESSGKNRMPPAKAGYAPLSPDEKAAIRQWILNGAKD